MGFFNQDLRSVLGVTECNYQLPIDLDQVDAIHCSLHYVSPRCRKTPPDEAYWSGSPQGRMVFLLQGCCTVVRVIFCPRWCLRFFLVTFRCSQVTWLSLELSVVLFVKKTHDVRLVNGRYGVTSVFFLVNDLNHVLTNRSRNIKSLYSPASPGGCQRRVQAWSFAVWHGELFFGGNWNWMTRSFLPM